jgi:transcriptional regulator with XRE-family HTH domain
MAEEARRLCEGAAVLAVWRGKRGLAKAALARRAGLSASYVAEIETGPSVAALMRW